MPTCRMYLGTYKYSMCCIFYHIYAPTSYWKKELLACIDYFQILRDASRVHRVLLPERMAHNFPCSDTYHMYASIVRKYQDYCYMRVPSGDASIVKILLAKAQNLLDIPFRIVVTVRHMGIYQANSDEFMVTVAGIGFTSEIVFFMEAATHDCRMVKTHADALRACITDSYCGANDLLITNSCRIIVTPQPYHFPRYVQPISVLSHSVQTQ
jgi:hypothetical protein